MECRFGGYAYHWRSTEAIPPKAAFSKNVKFEQSYSDLLCAIPAVADPCPVGRAKFSIGELYRSDKAATLSQLQQGPYVIAQIFARILLSTIAALARS